MSLFSGVAEIHFKGVMFRFSSFLGVLHGRVNASHGRRDGHRGEGGPVQPRTGTKLRLMDLQLIFEASTNNRFPSDQIAAIEEAFYNFDENNDGLITSTEFRKILDRLGEKGGAPCIFVFKKVPCLNNHIFYQAKVLIASFSPQPH